MASLLWLSTAALAGLIVALTVLLRARVRRYFEEYRGPPRLPAWPIVGSLPVLRNPDAPHLFFQELQAQYGPTYSLKMGAHTFIMINHHLHAREVLLKKGKIFAGRSRTVTTDVLTRDGKDIAFGDYSATWKFHRKIVHGALAMFGEGSASLEKLICREAQSLCDILSQGQAMDISPELTRAVTNTVCSLCFSTSYRRGDPEFEDMLRYSKGIVDTVAKDSLVDIFPWLQYFPNAGLHLLKQCVEVRDQLLMKKYNEHKAHYSDNVQRDLLDALLRAKRSADNNNTTKVATETVGLSDDHLLMTVADVFGAGVETTSTVLRWTIAYLLHYPELQRHIQEELDIKLGGTRTPLLSDRGSLPYLEATIREAMRIRPVAPLMIPHVALSDTSIGDFAVKKGDRVVVNLWSLHHNEEDWKNPELFDPGVPEQDTLTAPGGQVALCMADTTIGRFLTPDGTGLTTPPPGYLPFGTGVRVCLGEALAKMELFLFLAWILQRFVLSVPEGEPLPCLQGKFAVVVQPAPYRVKATLRPGWANKPPAVVIR